MKKRHSFSGSSKRQATMPAKVERYWIETAGFAAPGAEDSFLWVYPGKSRCGQIKDGVALAHGKHGSWLISYADLIELADRATAARGRKKAGPR